MCGTSLGCRNFLVFLLVSTDTACKIFVRPRSNEELFELVNSSPGAITLHAGSPCETDPESGPRQQTGS